LGARPTIPSEKCEMSRAAAGFDPEAAKNNWAVNVGVIGGLLLAAAQAM
jgi:hypothetical protein